MKKTIVSIVAMIAITATASVAAAAGQPKITYRLKIPARIARKFASDVRTEAATYGYPVHGCAYTKQHRIYGCSVSAPGDWQLLTRLRPNVYYETDVHGDTKRFRWTP